MKGIINLEVVTERELSKAEVDAVNHHAENALKIIGLADNSESPLTIVQAIQARLEAERRHIAELPKAELNEIVLSLGALWGQQVCYAYSWVWRALVSGKSMEVYAVVSPDRTYYSAPFALILKHISQPERENTIILAFNMLSKPNVPTAQPRSYIGLG